MSVPVPICQDDIVRVHALHCDLHIRLCLLETRRRVVPVVGPVGGFGAGGERPVDPGVDVDRSPETCR